jgi:hypothetical protein
MGQDVAARVFSRADGQRYREKVRVCLDVFARMLAESRFEPARGSFGLQIELNLTGDNGTPAMANAAVLEAIADPDFQTIPTFRPSSTTTTATSRSSYRCWTPRPVTDTSTSALLLAELRGRRSDREAEINERRREVGLEPVSLEPPEARRPEPPPEPTTGPEQADYERLRRVH